MTSIVTFFLAVTSPLALTLSTFGLIKVNSWSSIMASPTNVERPERPEMSKMYRSHLFKRYYRDISLINPYSQFRSILLRQLFLVTCLLWNYIPCEPEARVNYCLLTIALDPPVASKGSPRIILGCVMTTSTQPYNNIISPNNTLKGCSYPPNSFLHE